MAGAWEAACLSRGYKEKEINCYLIYNKLILLKKYPLNRLNSNSQINYERKYKVNW